MGSALPDTAMQGEQGWQLLRSCLAAAAAHLVTGPGEVAHKVAVEARLLQGAVGGQVQSQPKARGSMVGSM